jgi:hypothetical protein
MTTAKFKPLTFSVGLRLVQCSEHFHFHDFGRFLLVACMILLCNHKRTEFCLKKVKVKVILRPTVSRPVCPGVRHSSKMKLFYDWQSASLGARFLLSLWRFRVSWCGAPPLTRGWVCNLLVQLRLGLARAVTLGSKSCRTHGHILLSHLILPQPGEPGPRIYIPQEQGGPVIPPGTGFTFCRLLRLKVEVTLGPTVSRPVLLYNCFWALQEQSHDLQLQLIYDRQSVLVSGAHLGPVTNFSSSLKFLLDSCRFEIL